LIERLPHTQRYRVTDSGWRTAWFCTRVYTRLLRPGPAQLIPPEVGEDSPLRGRFDQLDEAVNQWIEDQMVPA
jgi:hypothetical protein